MNGGRGLALRHLMGESVFENLTDSKSKTSEGTIRVTMIKGTQSNTICTYKTRVDDKNVKQTEPNLRIFC